MFRFRGELNATSLGFLSVYIFGNRPGRKGMIPRYQAISRIPRRTFSSYTHNLVQKSLVDKIRAAPGSRNDLTLKQSVSFYWEWLTTPTKKLLRKYEDALVETIKLPIGVQLTRTKVAGLHQFHLSSADAKAVETPTLLVHGYGASSIFYHRNFNALSTHIKNVYALDTPDIGLSDRKPLQVRRVKQKVKIVKPKDDTQKTKFTISQNKDKNLEQVHKVQGYYVDAIDEWRKAHGFEKFNLVSHSFGSLMSFSYALKYPQHVNKLVLCSPAGVERSIFSLNNTLTEGSISEDPSKPNYYRPSFIPRFISLVGFNLTRMLGPFGIQAISKYLSMRYSRGSTFDEQVKLLVKYTIALFHQRSNSMKNLQVVLNNQILAHDPMLDHSKELQVSTAVMYGAYDWMNSQAGYQLCREIQEADKVKELRFSVIQNAGHNVFLDNHEEFDKQVIDFLKEN
ncbi:CYFA0S11e03026g1_1 [Cyberlindnera fabianii]|uniref:CYFA0S11e03026g1_1 n=1 Tax=Cyberlindnera fabianii TaxID=36022 RepID=A0A061B034_CYBFA|nr:CYFA0S11e03026g1_1 [Cyberlindnera fabianii]